jgi:hypothetical protein
VKDMKRDQKLVNRLNEIGVRWAESRHKTFHCITPDCGQWWFIEQLQGNNIVYCDVCIISYFWYNRSFMCEISSLGL